MEILHIITHGGFAGSEKIAIDIANNQAESGDDVSVILRESKTHSNKFIAGMLHSNINKYFVKQSASHPDTQFKILQDHPDFEELKKINIIHAHLPYGCQLGRMINEDAKIFVTQHVRYHHLYSYADGIFHVSPWQMIDTPEWATGKTTLAGNYLPRMLVQKGRVKREKVFKARSYYDSNKFNFLVVGRLELIKGIDVAVRAFKKANLSDKASLTIIGEGRERERIEKIIDGDDRILLVGAIDNAAEFMHLFDVLIIPSRFESFGLVALEGIFYGNALLLSKIPSFDDIVGDNFNGLFEVENVVALSRIIERVFVDKSEFVLKKKVLDRFTRKITVDRITQRYLELG